MKLMIYGSVVDCVLAPNKKDFFYNFTVELHKQPFLLYKYILLFKPLCL